jgi:hypothetical protein
MEGDALAELEDPGLGVIRRFEGLCQIGRDAAAGIDNRQLVAGGTAEQAGAVVRVGCRIQRVRGGAGADADLQRAALLRLRSDAHLAHHGGGHRGGDTQHRRAADEFAPADATFLDLLGPVFQFTHFLVSL